MVKITIRPVTRHKSNSVWVTYLFQGWKENDRWQRRQFKNEDEAKTFAALKQVGLENKGRAQRMILTSFTQGHHHSENLAAWLELTKHRPITPPNFKHLLEAFKKHFGQTHDEAPLPQSPSEGRRC